MATVLTDKIIRDLQPPHNGMKILRDAKVRGLGIRILPSGTRAFILDYSLAGSRRIYTIGKFPEWTTTAARTHAGELKHRIRYEGFDPASDLRASREAPTIALLCERFKAEHLTKLRPSTRKDYGRMMDRDVIPAIGTRKVADIRFEDISRLHRSITERGAPAAANFCIAMCSKIFSFAVQLEMTDRNPVRGIERNRAQPRNRYLTQPEIAALIKALALYSDQDIADLFRLLLFTGARRGETQSAKWDQIALGEGIWTKPAHTTKQNREHRVPLAAPARALLAKRLAKAKAEIEKLAVEITKVQPDARPALLEWQRRLETFLFPSRDSTPGHFVAVSRAWTVICKAAGITARRDEPAIRIHDLRHTAASVLASSGASLPLIGQLLGHTQVSTTQRYAHLFDDAQRAAVERLGAVIEGGPSAEVIDLRKRRKTP